MQESILEHYKPILVELVAFAKRPSMYLGKDDMDAVLAFIGGIELSSKFKLQFGSDLIDSIFRQYPDNMELLALKKNLNYYTLKQQTVILCKSTGKNPVQIFTEEATKLLVHISDIELGGYYLQTLTSHLKSALVKNLDTIDKVFTESFRSSPEDQIFRFLREWPGKSLKNEEMELLESIRQVNQSRNQQWSRRQPGDIDDKSELRELSKELLVRLSIASK